MMNKILFFLIFLLFSSLGYSQEKIPKQNEQHTIQDTTFVNLKDYSTDFVYDMRYATTSNFLKEKFLLNKAFCF